MHDELLEKGLAVLYRGRLIPVMRGGDPAADEPDDDALFAEVPEDLATLDDDALAALIEDYAETVSEVTGNPTSFVTGELSAADLIKATRAAMATLAKLREAAATRAATETAEPEPVELTAEEQAAIDELAAEAAAAETAEPDPEPEPEDEEPEVAAAVEPAVVAAAPAVRRGRMPRALPQHAIVEAPAPSERAVPLLAAAGAPDMVAGEEFQSDLQLAQSMIDRHRAFGRTGPGTVERYTIARADWTDVYPDDRKFAGNDLERNFEIVKPIIEPGAIKSELRKRIAEMDKDFSIVASGGLCAPVTPYYQLQYISVPIRPVMGSLPSFNADRGGLRYAQPAALSAITTGVGIITEAEDFAGGTSATKTCQVIACPPFIETDVDTIYHCLQFGNLGARAFPELVAQWNNLTLAAHARLAESNLLTAIDAFSTQVVAGNLGLGASASLFSQILAAANGLRSRNRMDPEAVLRLMLPWWSVDLIVSDIIRGQFQRFDTDHDRVIALLRGFNIEPTFYIDGANGRGQVFGPQLDGTLEPFPAHVVWYLFPEGSFIYLDSGVLELGIVRDSVLNKTNDFQLFGETFEQVAFVGVESLAVQSTVCDSGTVTLPVAVTCPISYAHGS